MTNNKAKFARAVTLFSLAGIAFSAPLGSLAIKSGAAPVTVGMYRMAFSVPMMAVVWLVSYLKSGKNEEEKNKPEAKHRLVTVLSGVFLALHFICWYLSLANTTVFCASALVSLQPLYAMLGALIIFKQKPARSVIIPLVVAILGSVVLVLPSAEGAVQGSFFGNAMAVVSGAFLAAYLMCGTYAMQKISLGGYATVAYGTCFLATLIVVLIFRVPVSFDERILFVCLALSVSATLIGHTLFNWSLPHVGAFFVTVVLLGEPVAASIVAFFMFGTVPGWVELLGGVMIIAGIAMMMMRAGRRAKTLG